MCMLATGMEKITDMQYVRQMMKNESKQTMVNVGQDFIQPKVWMILK